MKFTKIIYLAVFALSILLVSSCSDQENVILEEENFGSHLPENILNKVIELELNPSDFEFGEIDQIDGTSLQYIAEIGSDGVMNAGDFLQFEKKGTDKQYRTEFLVNTHVYRQIDIYGFTGNEFGQGLSQQSQEALIQAVKNWNKVRSNSIHFTLTFNSDSNVDTDIFETIVFAQQDLGSSGLAVFPFADGKPGNFVAVDNASVNLGNWNADALEHIFTHELGHTIGFRHTDWQTRRSCVEAGVSSELVAEPFAQLLPWTLPNIPGILYQDNSIMNACFNINITNGELNNFDKLGLKNMYFDPFSW